MSESSGVTTVLEKISSSHADWLKVRRAESCESLRQRVKDCSEIMVDLDQDTKSVDVLKSGPLLRPSRLSEKKPQPAPQGTAPRPQDVPAPKEQTALATQTSQMSSQKTAVMGGNEKTEQTAVKTLNVPSTSDLEKQPDTPGKVQESEMVLRDRLGASGTRNETAPGKKEPAEPVEAEPEEVKVESKVAKETESIELVETEAPENVEVKGSAAVCESLTPTTLPKPPTGPPQRPQTTLKTQQTSVKASSEVQEPVKPNPVSTTQELETTTEVSQEQQQKTGNSALVEAERNPTLKADKVSAVALEKTSSAQTESNQQSAAAGSQMQMNPSTSAPDLLLTPGEMLEESVALEKLCHASLKYKTIFSEKVFSLHISLAITNLSEFNNGCYTEADIIKLLHKNDIPCENNQLFVLPQIHMAFVLFPDVSKVRSLFKESKHKNAVLKGSKLSVFAVCIYKQSLHKFYIFLKYLAGFEKTNAEKARLVCIHNISQSEAAFLRQALRKIGRVVNYQPLLNKVIVEFLTSFDADRFGIWCSYLKPRFSYSVYRMGLPWSPNINVSPILPLQAFSDVTIARASHPTSPTGIPVGTVAPFWVTMRTSPYVYLTGSPWFNIPAFCTVSPQSQIQHLEPVKQKRLKVIMLTGLPMDTYTQEDIARLVWKYFPEQNLDSLYNNVMVLPLQRRAFVSFSRWEACFSFLKNHIRNPLYMRNHKLCIHYVLNNIFLSSCNEEILYTILMKWSNIYVPDLKSLKERLLCVEVSGGDFRLVSTVIKRVASIATFVSFLPLANRINIEMAESSGVTKVVETMSVSKSSEQCELWKKVGHVESLKSRKIRLQDSKKTAVNLELSNVGVYSDSTADKEAPKSGSDLAELGSLVLDPAAATVLSSRAMEDEARETEVPVCSIIDPKTDLGPAEEKKEESVTNFSPSATSLAQPQAEEADLSPIDSSSFKALKEAIHQYKLSHNKEVQEVQEDTKDSSEVCDKPDLNFEDFITIDEINEDEVDKDVSPSSKPTSRDSEGSCTASSEALKPSSSSSRSTGTSPSSTENQKHSLEPNKSQTNPSSSASKTSPFIPSSKSIQPSVSPGLKAQPIIAKGPSRASQALPTGRVTRSSAAVVKASVETPQSRQKKGELSGGAVAKVDHTASAESSTETSEIHPPSPVEKLETIHPTQRLETESKNEILKDVKSRKENDDGKSTEVTEKSKEDYQVISSVDEQISKESYKKTQNPGSEKDQVSLKECLHVSNEVNDDENCSEIKINVSVKDQSTNTKDESAVAQQEKGSPLKPDQAIEENQNVPVKEDGSQTEDRETVKDQKTNEGTKMVPENPFQEESVPKRSTRRSSRGTKDLKTSPDKVTIVTRSTRGRRTMTAEVFKDEGKEKTPTRLGRTLGRNEQELNNEDTPKVEDITPTNKTNTVGDTSGPKTSLEVSGESEEETKEAANPRKRGRPRKTTIVASPVLNKRTELVEPEAKRSRSPRVSADFKLPPFSPEKPLGTEFVSRKWGYFCNLCSVSYVSEGTNKDQHCRSQTHAENLQRYQQGLERKPPRISTRKSL